MLESLLNSYKNWKCADKKETQHICDEQLTTVDMTCRGCSIFFRTLSVAFAFSLQLNTNSQKKNKHLIGFKYIYLVIFCSQIDRSKAPKPRICAHVILTWNCAIQSTYSVFFLFSKHIMSFEQTRMLSASYLKIRFSGFWCSGNGQQQKDVPNMEHLVFVNICVQHRLCYHRSDLCRRMRTSGRIFGMEKRHNSNRFYSENKKNFQHWKNENKNMWHRNQMF